MGQCLSQQRGAVEGVRQFQVIDGPPYDPVKPKSTELVPGHRGDGQLRGELSDGGNATPLGLGPSAAAPAPPLQQHNSTGSNHATSQSTGSAQPSSTGFAAVFTRVSELLAYLRWLCEHTDGYINDSVCIKRQTLRRAGSYTALADTSEGATVIFFIDDARWKRQVQQYNFPWALDCLPRVRAQFPVGSYINQKLKRRLHIPAHMIVDLCTPFEEVIARGSIAPKDTAVDVFFMHEEVYHIMTEFHRHRQVLRDISVLNIAQTSRRGTRTWILLDYSSATKEGRMASHLPVRVVPPENAWDVTGDKPIELKPSFDVWQFGMMLYESCMNIPYWDERLSDEQVLQRLHVKQLPHDVTPVSNTGMQAILRQFLHTDPAQRPSGSVFRDVLGEVGVSPTITNTIVQYEQTILATPTVVLPG